MGMNGYTVQPLPQLKARRFTVTITQLKSLLVTHSIRLLAKPDNYGEYEGAGPGNLDDQYDGLWSLLKARAIGKLGLGIRSLGLEWNDPTHGYYILVSPSKSGGRNTHGRVKITIEEGWK
jgi:hypothetical protein